jgi:hypothetical protein
VPEQAFRGNPPLRVQLTGRELDRLEPGAAEPERVVDLLDDDVGVREGSAVCPQDGQLDLGKPVLVHHPIIVEVASRDRRGLRDAHSRLSRRPHHPERYRSMAMDLMIASSSAASAAVVSGENLASNVTLSAEIRPGDAETASEAACVSWAAGHGWLALHLGVSNVRDPSLDPPRRRRSRRRGVFLELRQPRPGRRRFIQRRRRRRRDGQFPQLWDGPHRAERDDALHPRR